MQLLHLLHPMQLLLFYFGCFFCFSYSFFFHRFHLYSLPRLTPPNGRYLGVKTNLAAWAGTIMNVAAEVQVASIFP